MLDHTILGNETFSDNGSYSNSNAKKDDAQVEEAKVT